MRNELTFHNHVKGMEVAKTLLDEDYVVLLSYEEDLLVLNYEWSERGADRNDVVFMREDEFYEMQDKWCEDIISDIKSDIKAGRFTVD